MYFLREGPLRCILSAADLYQPRRTHTWPSLGT
jgi:hypothetical protein